MIDNDDVNIDLLLECAVKYQLLNKIIIETYYDTSDIAIKNKIRAKIFSKFISKERV